MTKRTRKFIKLLLILAILATLGLIGLRLFRFQRAISSEVRFSEPNIKNKEVTIPGRPHAIPELLAHKERIKRRVTFRFSTNSQGLRGKEFSVEKAPGTYRIVCAGECVTFGNGVNDDQTYPARLEALLREAYPDRKIEVINAGTNGAPPVRILQLLREKYVNYSPDLLVFAPGADTVFFGEHTGQAPPRVRLEEGEYQQRLALYTNQLSEAISLSRQHRFRMLMVTPTMNSFFLPDGMRYLEELKNVALSYDVPVVDTTTLFRRLEHEKGLELVTTSGKQRLISHVGGAPEVLYETKAPSDNTRHVAPDIYAYLDAHPNVAPLLSIDDNHPNAQGHELIAKQLFEAIQAGRYLEDRPSGRPGR